MDYEVGYGKPPRDTRLRKGELSANSRGRQTVMRSSSNSGNPIPGTTAMIYSCVSTDSLHARDL